jgi:hypothetical protein
VMHRGEKNGFLGMIGEAPSSALVVVAGGGGGGGPPPGGLLLHDAMFARPQRRAKHEQKLEVGPTTSASRKKRISYDFHSLVGMVP